MVSLHFALIQDEINKQKQVFVDTQARTLQLSPPTIPVEETSKGKTVKDGKATEEEEDPTKSIPVDLKLEPKEKDLELIKCKGYIFKKGTHAIGDSLVNKSEIGNIEKKFLTKFEHLSNEFCTNRQVSEIR